MRANNNKTRTSKVGAISKTQKAKAFKIVRGALGFSKIQFVAKIKKIEEGPIGDIKKFSDLFHYIPPLQQKGGT